MRSQISILIIFVITLLAPACEPVQIISTLSSGYTQQQEFRTAIPFTLKRGLIFIHPRIKGKLYNFVLDSGAPTVLDSSLAEALRVDSVTELGLKDSKGRNSTSTLGEMDSMRLGSVQFLEFGTAIADLKNRFPFYCMEMDGIIGSNLMRLAVWQIDFENEMIHIASHKDSLPHTAGPYRYEFSEGIIYGIPSVDDFLLEGDEFTIDLGSTHALTLNNGVFDDVVNRFPVQAETKGIGYNSYGFNGSIADTVRYAVIKDVVIGGRSYRTEIMSTHQDDNLMGTQFLKNFLVTLDWKENYMALKPRKDYEAKIAFDQGSFRLFLEDDNLTIGKIFITSTAYQKGIRFDDRLTDIYSLNGLNHYPGDPCQAFLWQREHYTQDTLVIVRKTSTNLDTLYLN